ncbi:MAG TPA: hypothetical protein VMV86_05795 [Methanosarcinales archaeon]|nr:hypothetical protein [Methanosarcinales archaeon]
MNPFILGKIEVLKELLDEFNNTIEINEFTQCDADEVEDLIRKKIKEVEKQEKTKGE